MPLKLKLIAQLLSSTKWFFPSWIWCVKIIIGHLLLFLSSEILLFAQHEQYNSFVILPNWKKCPKSHRKIGKFFGLDFPYKTLRNLPQCFSFNHFLSVIIILSMNEMKTKHFGMTRNWNGHMTFRCERAHQYNILYGIPIPHEERKQQLI